MKFRGLNLEKLGYISVGIHNTVGKKQNKGRDQNSEKQENYDFLIINEKRLNEYGIS